MIEKWYVIKVSEEVKKTYDLTDSFVVCKYRDDLDKLLYYSKHITILITPSKEIAEITKRALNGQLQK